MKPSTKIIVYDDTCPMCNWYTGVFIKTGLLGKDGRQSFSNLSPNVSEMIDANKCRNEIPLVDMETGKILYGTDALVNILSNKFGIVEKVMKLRPINKLIKYIYKLISYNRRVIVAPAPSNYTSFDCTPDFNIRYRVIWLLVGLLFNTLMLFPLQHLIFSNSVFASVTTLELQIAHFALVCSNIFIATHLPKKQGLEYLGQINMLAITGTLLCIPLLLVNKTIAVNSLVNNLYLTAVLFITIKEYCRRMVFAEIFKTHLEIVAINVFCLVMFLLYISN